MWFGERRVNGHADLRGALGKIVADPDAPTHSLIIANFGLAAAVVLAAS